MKPMGNIEIIGAERLLAGFKKYRKEADKAVKRGVDRTAIAIETDAKTRLQGGLGGQRRIDTDRLRSSVHAELKQGDAIGSDSLGVRIAEDEAVTGTNVFYGPFIEFGTRYINAMSFLGYAAVRQSKRLRERVIEELNKVAKG